MEYYLPDVSKEAILHAHHDKRYSKVTQNYDKK